MLCVRAQVQCLQALDMSSGVRSAALNTTTSPTPSSSSAAAAQFPDFITLNHHSFALLAGFFLVEDSLMKTVGND
jgi:hypothetical protein